MPGRPPRLQSPTMSTSDHEWFGARRQRPSHRSCPTVTLSIGGPEAPIQKIRTTSVPGLSRSPHVSTWIPPPPRPFRTQIPVHSPSQRFAYNRFAGSLGHILQLAPQEGGRNMIYGSSVSQPSRRWLTFPSPSTPASAGQEYFAPCVGFRPV